MPCDALFSPRYRAVVQDAMNDREIRETLANAAVIEKRCGK